MMREPDEAMIAQAFMTSLMDSSRHEQPFRHWLLARCLPEATADSLVALPMVAPRIGDTRGKRESHNDSRTYFGEANRRRFPAMDNLARAFQSDQVVGALAAVVGAQLSGTSLRIEYCQDTDGFWLEPHTDIGAKKFTMLLYLNREPQGNDWGTDIYANRDTHVRQAPAGFNRGMIFVPGDNTWHGFERRPIDGIRRTLIVNYVGPEWRNRHELCFPDAAIR